MSVETAFTKLGENKRVTRNELIQLLKTRGASQQKLFTLARHKKELLSGKKIFVRLCIEASNICKNTCLFCGITRGNKSLPRYKLNVEEIKKIIDENYDGKTGLIQLSCGESSAYTIGEICAIIMHAKKYCGNITIGIGHRNEEEYKQMFKSGAANYLLKFETSNPKQFRIIRPEAKLSQRLFHIQKLREIGFRIGSGNIVGLPNQVLSDIANDLLLMKKLDLYQVESSVFCPTKGSAYENEKTGDIDTTLNCIALSRLVTDAPLILASSSLKGRFKEAFSAGANYISVHGAPDRVFKYYSIYGGETRRKFDAKLIAGLNA